MESKIEHIIVGGGLAGLLLAWELHKRATSFIIFSNDKPASSSVAAGTWNPVSFRTMTPTWRAQEMIDKMDLVYHEIDAKFGTSMYGKIKVCFSIALAIQEQGCSHLSFEHRSF